MKFDMNPLDSVRDAVTLLDFLNKAKTADEAAKIRALLEKQGVRICPSCQGTKQTHRYCNTCYTSSGGVGSPLKFGKGTGHIKKDRAKAYQRDNLVPKMCDCPNCRGMGCRRCGNKGQLYDNDFQPTSVPDFSTHYICPTCSGSGMESEACSACNGTGIAR